MYRLLAFSFLALFVIQCYGLDETDGDRNLVAEWSQRASHALENKAKRDTQGAVKDPSAEEQLQNILQGFNEGLKSVIANVSSSQIYQDMQKMGENLGAKGKELVDQLQQQVKSFQTKQ